MVRLKHNPEITYNKIDFRLNSTMVRLKHMRILQLALQVTKSQFHYGSIKTILYLS